MNIKELYNAIFLNKKIGPEKVMISPTDYCNLRCKTCWRLAKNGNYDELKFEEIKKLLQECKKLGVKIIDLTGGGEPFFRKDMLKIIEMVKAYGFFETLTTNGTLLDEKKIKKLIELRLDDICFSLDGHNKKINDYIRGKGVYEKVVNAIKKMNEIKKKYSSELPVIRISTTITKHNYKDLDKIVELVHKLNIKAINFSVLTEWKSNKELWMRDQNPKIIKNSLKKAQNSCEKYKIHSNLKSILKYGLFEHEKPNFCFAPWNTSFVNASGDVMICCTLASLYENVIGNIKKENFRKIWFGKKINEFRKRILEGRLPEECKRCLPEFTEMYNEAYSAIKKFNKIKT